ncbi:paramyosin [Colias croceus]|uniref:paramyosin n=1 Tax=Colias crocea TaxID=72248 RepID=UPI001E27FFEF|nr:paramyosin [Colias croceus]
MGNILSGATNQASSSREALSSESETMESKSDIDDANTSDNSDEQYHDTVSDDEEARARSKEEEMLEFRRQLDIKREQRKEILARHKSDKKTLEDALKEERKAKLQLYEQNRHFRDLLVRNNIDVPEIPHETEENALFKEALDQLTKEMENQKANNNRLRCDLANSNAALQSAYSDMADLSAQNAESMKQIHALKEVITVSKTMISLREDQLTELKNKLTEIEQSLADREANMLSTDLRQEYERQLQNIRTLRGLYEERARLAEVTRQALVRDLDEQKALYEAEHARCNDLNTELEEMKTKIVGLEETVEDKNNEIFTCKQEMDGIKSEMAVIHKLFSQVLLGYKTKRDLDKLVKLLEENHGILTHMAEQESGSQVSSALPKLLLELVNQVDDSNKETIEDNLQTTTNDESANGEQGNYRAEEIVQNLPKVWRVLIELLSHQSDSNANETEEKVTTCYKTVETKSGSVQVPSVSQTYIRLKDLIIEKLSLIKEVNRMKQLNTHLETRLQEQERRLCLVTTELSKTWHVVGRLRKHHHQLHTHEKILKYELQQKRKLLNELKEELEYCREKLEQAREKNTQSEKDWKELRAEFSSRKLKDTTSLNNSAESGYSDEKPTDESSESNDESEYIAESKLKCKKKFKKSFETVVDSSADFNLAAERDDPVSDMIDVADLSLDTQDENQEILDDSCSSENLLKSDKICYETEDEAADIVIDSCHEESSAAETNTEYDKAREIDIKPDAATTCNISDSDLREKCLPSSLSDSQHPSVSLIDPATILENIKKQNERLAEKDRKLNNLEKNSSELMDKANKLSKFSNDINSTLDNLLNKPTSSGKGNRIHKENEHLNKDEGTENVNSLQTDVVQSVCGALETNSSAGPSLNNTDLTENSENKFKQILENVKKQDEHLKHKDEKLDKLQSECSEVVTSISNAINKGQQLNERLSALHTKFYKNSDDDKGIQNGESQQSNSFEKTDVDVTETELHNQAVENVDMNMNNKCDDNVTVVDNKNDQSASNEVSQKETVASNSIYNQAEASTSNEIDHEARFAARDIRLKRLEEQTKSLVSKVNKTATKGVKINYKLEELHNIYGSDQSRSGTPSEDTGDNSQSNDDEKENETK